MLNKINEVKNGRESSQQKQVISNLGKFYKSRDEVWIFLEIILKWFLKVNTKQNMEQDLKY